MPLEAELRVSDAIKEMMLGIDWLTEHGCHWKFDERLIVLPVVRSRPRADPPELSLDEFMLNVQLACRQGLRWIFRSKWPGRDSERRRRNGF